jgi:type VI protein secretion system component VasK
MATMANTCGTHPAARGDWGEKTDGSRKHRLRPIPNEDLYLFVKAIDNSRVVRQADPQARWSVVKFIGSSFGVALLLVVVMLPHAWGLMANYQVEALRQEQKRLVEDRDALEVEEASLTSTERLLDYARQRNFDLPAPQDEIYIESKSVLSADAR